MSTDTGTTSSRWNWSARRSPKSSDILELSARSARVRTTGACSPLRGAVRPDQSPGAGAGPLRPDHRRQAAARRKFAFVDEIFKSNSAVLNALLSVINERVFHNDGAPVRCPLVSLFAASNELPEDKELEALFDRFLLRFDVGYLLVAANLRGVLVGPEPAIAATLTMDELRRAQGEVAAVKVTDDTVDALLAIRDACRGEGITASDRRWKKSLGIVRASAWLAGEKKTCPEDLAILVDSLWREPKERAKVARIVGNLADPASMQAVEILDAAREIGRASCRERVSLSV